MTIKFNIWHKGDKMSEVKIIEQGDILLIRVDELPAGVKKRVDRTLAFGETSGHHHTLTGGTIYGVMSQTQWVVVNDEKGVDLEHQPVPGLEHNTVHIPKGIWLVPVQVEDDGEKERRAMD
jgi:hypothetical protein